MNRLSADFRSVFKNFLDDPDTNTLIEKVCLTRDEMAKAMVNRNLVYEQKISTVDDYLAAITTLYESLLAQGGVKVSQNFVFEWIMYVNGTGESFKSSDMVFELIMVLHLKAILHYYTARNMLEMNVHGFLTDAGKQLLIASSIMDFLGENLTPERWGKPLHHSQPNPSEANPRYCAALSLYFRTCAQICASIKAFDNTSASAMVRSRVAVAALNYATRCIASFVELKAVNKLFVSQVAITRELCSAVADWQLAVHSYEKQEVGNAMGCCQRAKVR